MTILFIFLRINLLLNSSKSSTESPSPKLNLGTLSPSRQETLISIFSVVMPDHLRSLDTSMLLGLSFVEIEDSSSLVEIADLSLLDTDLVSDSYFLRGFKCRVFGECTRSVECGYSCFRVVFILCES